MPLVPCLGFVGLAFAAIGFADLHLFGFAPPWVRAPIGGNRTRILTFEGALPSELQAVAWRESNPLPPLSRPALPLSYEGLRGYGVLFHPPPLGLGHSTA